jgi:transposase-like protein
MLREELVWEIAARRDRGESTRRIARQLGVDRKTILRWLR